MASIIDRLLGRPEPVATAKAVTGPGAYALTWHPSIRSLSRDQHKLMAEGEALYHSQPWVAGAEDRLGERFARMPWHLENLDGDTINDTSGPQERAVLRLLERPAPYKARAALWGITFRHMGLAGNAYWYLDQRDRETGIATTIRYLNPARVSIVNVNGERRGYIVDARDNRVTGGTGDGFPLELEEVIHFPFHEPDWGDYGSGIPEAAQRKIELDRLADTHSGGVLGSGGRLSGLVAPKVGEQMSDDQWVQFARDWRRIAEDPDAAKRLQIAKVPLDFTQMTASPKDLQLADVSTGSRDDILAIWGVPKSQFGMDVPSGLNADRSDGDSAVIWETIKGRAEPFREKVQIEFLDRFELGLQLVFDYPEFDDETPLFERAAKSVYIALTNQERRAIAGFDPLEDELLGSQVWIDSSLVRLDAPPPEPVVVPEPVLPVIEEDPLVAKARLGVQGLRERAEKRYQPKLEKALQAALTEQRDAVLRSVRAKYSHLAAKAKDTDAWWNPKAEDARLSKAILPLLEAMTVETVRNLRSTLVIPAMKADPNLERILRFVRTQAAARITGINQTTRDAIAKVIAQGISDGSSIQDLTRDLGDATPFNAARAELISRTETALAYNESALTTFREYEVTEVEAIDGDDDAECASRNGKRYPVDEAFGISDHPNGTLDWVPVVKAVVEPDPLSMFAESVKAVLEREPPAPVVNVYPSNPDVHVHLPDPKPARRVLERDADGRLIGVRDL